ncbi:small nucleolar ribonucleoprotein complex [Grosmannia clavigera kw1407]|uniref:Small nucleolar ribonucleoprotein complex n=1 Tax=Grosmannia clavigera (strain kw1407 / UAMH 11150) TaxID=655863 RepID=F0XKE7_GROCL|nr:small nucleolar ribonucleoprotein complex [Grosmannia clavigera kw1407]EFX01720.1 small nucleolar ribonucleoprotein complex [Grosmannia clavigera kw1407]
MAQRQVSKEVDDTMELVSEAESSDWEIDKPQNEPKTPRRGAKVLVVEKDAEEADLERLVLGDKAGFRSLLFQSDEVDNAEDYLKDLSLATVPAEEDDTGLGELDDSNMFFTDEGMVLSAPADGTAFVRLGEGATRDLNAPAWDDSDDERLRVSLAGHTRLRKLRRYEGEDIVSGAEYSERLRQQYLRLNPQPDWAADAEKARMRRESKAAAASEKRRQRRKSRSSGPAGEGRTSGDSDLSDSGSASGDDDKDADGFGTADDALPLDTFFRSAGSLAGASAEQHLRKRRRLQPETLGIQKTRDMATVHVGPVDSLAFHPRFAVLLSASTSSVLHLHQVAPGAQPVPNPLLTSVRVRQLPVRRAAFLGRDGGRVIFAGRRRFFHTWDLGTGHVQRVSHVQGHQLEQRSMERFRPSPATGDADSDEAGFLAVIATDRKGGGMLNILRVQTMQWEAQARLDSRGGIADFQWWRDGTGITILGRDGRVGEWCLATRRFVGLWRDDGSTGGTTLGLGGSGGPDVLGGDRWVAVGSNSGIVNIYDRQTLLDTAAATDGVTTLLPTPAPTRCFEQLTTPVTEVVFTPDGQLLAFASRHKTDALRLAHLPSCTVYRNWPTQQTPLGRITALAFSKDSDMLAVGNDVGKTRLWEIRG